MTTYLLDNLTIDMIVGEVDIDIREVSETCVMTDGVDHVAMINDPWIAKVYSNFLRPNTDQLINLFAGDEAYVASVSGCYIGWRRVFVGKAR